MKVRYQLTEAAARILRRHTIDSGTSETQLRRAGMCSHADRTQDRLAAPLESWQRGEVEARDASPEAVIDALSTGRMRPATREKVLAGLAVSPPTDDLPA